MLVTTLGYGAAVPNACVAHVQLHRTRGARFHVSGIPWTAGRNAILQQHARTFNTSTRGLSHLHTVARLHAAWEQRTEGKGIEIGEDDAAFASQMRIFDRPRWWEKPEMP